MAEKIEVDFTAETKKVILELANSIYALASATKGVPIPEGVAPSKSSSMESLNPDVPHEIAVTQNAFDDDMAELLNFAMDDNYVILRPKRFLGSQNFAKIGSTVRSLGGEYVSAGKNSHFRIAKAKLREKVA